MKKILSFGIICSGFFIIAASKTTVEDLSRFDDLNKYLDTSCNSSCTPACVIVTSPNVLKNNYVYPYDDGALECVDNKWKCKPINIKREQITPEGQTIEYIYPLLTELRMYCGEKKPYCYSPEEYETVWNPEKKVWDCVYVVNSNENCGKPNNACLSDEVCVFKTCMKKCGRIQEPGSYQEYQKFINPNTGNCIDRVNPEYCATSYVLEPKACTKLKPYCSDVLGVGCTAEYCRYIKIGNSCYNPSWFYRNPEMCGEENPKVCSFLSSCKNGRCVPNILRK